MLPTTVQLIDEDSSQSHNLDRKTVFCEQSSYTIEE